MKIAIRILATIVFVLWALFLGVQSYQARWYAQRACMVGLQTREFALKMIDLHDVPPSGAPADDNLPPVPDVNHAFAGCDISGYVR